MATRLSEARLMELSALIADRMGLYFPRKRWGDLECAVHAIARELGFDDIESCVRWLLVPPFSKEQVEALAAHLTVGETYFFRESPSFEVLEKHVLPDLIQSRRKSGKRLRIWSAGCCTGEEPYSIAMLLSRMIPDIEDWDITILGTDINVRYLDKAAAGIYARWSFRDPSLKIRERYFKQIAENRFELLPRIRNMVTFSYLNLAGENYPSEVSCTRSMDVIFCRNVLMYFALGRVKRVAHQLNRCLADGGWLFVAPTDACYLTFSEFSATRFPGVILYRRLDRPRHGEAAGLTRALHLVRPAPPEISFHATAVPNELPAPDVDRITVLKPQRAPDGTVEAGGAPADLSLYMEASLLYQKGCYAEAKEKTKELLSIIQDDADSIALLARICANEGKLDEALGWCEEAIRADKLNPEHRYLHATILQEHGQEESAIASLRRALYLDQSFVMAHVALGNLMRLHCKRKDWERHFTSALSLLDGCGPDDLVPESEGIKARELAELIRSAIGCLPESGPLAKS